MCDGMEKEDLGEEQHNHCSRPLGGILHKYLIGFKRAQQGYFYPGQKDMDCIKQDIR